MKSLPQPLEKPGTAGTCSREKMLPRYSFEPEKRRALVVLGLDEGVEARRGGKCRCSGWLRSGVPPRCAPVRGGGTRPPAPLSAGLSLRSQLPRPPTKMKRKGMGRGERGGEAPAAPA